MITLLAGQSKASVQISHYHTNIVLMTKNDTVVYENQDCDEIATSNLTDRSLLNVKDILDFAETVELNDIEELLQCQIDYNMAIAEEGLSGQWGANIGSVLLDTWGDDVKVRAKALAAAGSRPSWKMKQGKPKSPSCPARWPRSSMSSSMASPIRSGAVRTAANTSGCVSSA